MEQIVIGFLITVFSFIVGSKLVKPRKEQKYD